MSADYLDAHQHFWDPARRRPSWLAPGSPLDQRFEPPELRAAMGNTPVTATVAVQADAWLEDTLELLDRTCDASWIVGVVGWVDTRGDVAGQLDRLYSHAAGSRLVGVRVNLTETACDPVALAPLAEAGLALDVLADVDCLDAVVDIAGRLPDLPIVLDHLGQPRSDRLDAWRDAVAGAARCGNIVAKLSGLTTALPARGCAEAAVGHALDCFGADRILFGSDWPVSTLAGGYADTVRYYEQFGLGTDVFATNAGAVYGLT